ncbi:hypothetical protein EXN66_Car007942 [Channa argus]|uniref:Uncharacterized protein n=1 Tax=Channa argus TaxID=215402 RepID=A0A6G1PQJ6_CHAAH|nr:hypothetical protein EXN66_Car007942 [Channa argus]KAK2909882.1 hypothetical protein Q8A73_007597 [Channa argus]
MTSNPSASALSAVLRCRGNIWTRNTPTQRPANAGYSLGLAGGALRDSPDERTRPRQTSAWEAFVKAERVAVTRKLSVACRSPRVPANILTGDAHSASHAVQNALARRLIRGRSKGPKIIFTYETHPAHVCKRLFAQEISIHPTGVVFKVSIRLMENAGHLVKTLKSTCLTLTVLVSGMMLLWTSSSSSSPDGASHHEENIKRRVHQANRQTHSPTDLPSSKGNFGCGQKITEDRPD